MLEIHAATLGTWHLASPASILPAHEATLRAPLSRPTPPRSTPITTTAPPFSIYLDAEGATEVQIAG